MPLRERASAAFDAAIEALGEDPEPRALAALTAARDSLSAPMRVAVVGRIKAGKSTLMNALLGADLAPTGTVEVTFTVTWFVHSDDGQLEVEWKDGRPAQRLPLSDLRRLVDRTGGDPAVLAAVRHVRVGLPLPVLQRLQLVDTPGFGSVYETDSANTLDLLGLTGDAVDRVTRDQAVQADAIAYLFSRGIAGSDRDRAEEFQGESLGDVTPLNAIAVLTKADAYWTASDAATDPLDAVGPEVERLRSDHGLDRVFYDVLPACGLLASGASRLTDDHLAVLDDLARLDPDLLRRRLRYPKQFPTAAYDDVPVPPAARGEVAGLVGTYGVWVACGLLRDGVTGLDELRPLLDERSGVARIRRLLLEHFGNRAAAIKASAATTRSRAALRDAGQSRGAVRRHAARADGALESFADDEHAFAELRLLRSIYTDAGRLGLTSDEVDEVVALTGEHGTGCAARLRADGDPAALLALTRGRIVHWRRRGTGFGVDNRTVLAARTVVRSYEVVAHHLHEAQRHLAMDF